MQKSAIKNLSNPDDVMATWELYLLRHPLNRKGVFLKISETILLTVNLSSEITIPFKLPQHSCVAMTISNGFK